MSRHRNVRSMNYTDGMWLGINIYTHFVFVMSISSFQSRFRQFCFSTFIYCDAELWPNLVYGLFFYCGLMCILIINIIIFFYLRQNTMGTTMCMGIQWMTTLAYHRQMQINGSTIVQGDNKVCHRS